MPLIDNYLLDNYAIDGPSSEKYAWGSISAVSGTNMPGTYFKTGDVTTGLTWVSVNWNLDFDPKLVILRYNDPNASTYSILTEYIRDFKRNGYSYAVARNGGAVHEIYVSTKNELPINFYVNEAGFRLHTGTSGFSASIPFIWEAFG